MKKQNDDKKGARKPAASSRKAATKANAKTTKSSAAKGAKGGATPAKAAKSGAAKSPKSTEPAANFPETILEAFEQIVTIAKDSQMAPDTLKKMAVPMLYAASKLKLTPTPTILLAILFDCTAVRNDGMTISRLANFINCTGTKTLRIFANSLNVLEDLNYIEVQHSRHDTVSYRVTDQAFDALKNDKAYHYKPLTVNDTVEFFDVFGDLVEKCVDTGTLPYQKFLTQTQELLGQIKHTEFYKQLKRYKMRADDNLLFIYMAYLFVENSDDCISFDDLRSIYDERDDFEHHCRRPFRSGISPLLAYKLIEHANEEGLARPNGFKLTEEAKMELLSELELGSRSVKFKDLISPDTIAEKKLFYNAAEAKQVAELSSLLRKENFEQVQSRLNKKGLRKGFCCLLYGAPGTGKTETVYQLSRQTGRKIFRVDVDKIKNCYVGESEKNIKAVFKRYRFMCKNEPLTPILLFNEADAVLGVRMEGASHAVDKMENSIQNIILQEMETLDGIMMATTNLTSNLDKAFERRFLYKIKYEKPSKEVRQQIWQSMLPGMKTGDYDALSAQFDLSGGEIENITRKHFVDSILHSRDEVDMAALVEHIRHERLSSAPRRAIGFRFGESR